MAINLDHVTEQITVTDDAANASLTVQSKGTGAINLAPGSSGVNISNGGTVTALTLTASGGNYTSTPTVAVSAPTTAGGVQAVATILMRNFGTPPIVSGGTGYTAGDTITVIGGTFSTATTATVSTVSAGVITAISITNQGAYTVLPTNPVSVTGGTGSGATFNLNFGVAAISIGTAGSGYVEQPTVTFSGGGGSGAAAYATVGSGTTVRSIGATLDLYSPNTGIGLRVEDSGGTSLNYWRFRAGGGQLLATAEAVISSSGSNSVRLFTGGIAQEQLRVAHTASAVNFVQVTGSATNPGGSALANILFTGSDASVNGAIVTKGTGYIAFAGGATTGSQALRVNMTNAVSTGNLIQIQGAAAGSAPSIQAISGASGTDANIDLTLTPKGTGNVRFGTYTNTALSIAGYIEIKDSGGTIRRLAVVA